MLQEKKHTKLTGAWLNFTAKPRQRPDRKLQTSVVFQTVFLNTILNDIICSVWMNEWMNTWILVWNNSLWRTITNTDGEDLPGVQQGFPKKIYVTNYHEHWRRGTNHGHTPWNKRVVMSRGRYHENLCVQVHFNKESSLRMIFHKNVVIKELLNN